MKWVWLFCVMLFTHCLKSQSNRYDVLITEIMFDPSPSIGLPNAEYIEIRNVSLSPVNLNGWKLSDASSTATINGNIILQPDSLLILCSNNNANALNAFGRAIGVGSFPSLDNDGDRISLTTAGKIIHAVSYEPGWHQNALKKEGGWSIEMVDIHLPCTGKENWTSSSDPRGGTPGRLNSVAAILTDAEPPVFIRAYAEDSLHIVIVLDEPLDSAHAVSLSHYSLDGFTILKTVVTPPLFQTVTLEISHPLERKKMYTLRIGNLTDCLGNAMTTVNVQIAMFEIPKVGEVIINEILFNPRPNGYDYVEIYNASSFVFDLQSLYIGSRNPQNQLHQLRNFSAEPWPLLPGSYAVITENKEILGTQYHIKFPETVFEKGNLSSWPDTEGITVLTDAAGIVLDELHYEDDWHFPLFSDKEGVSLERLLAHSKTQDANNWHSAASSAGYGTPGYQNSQSAKGSQTHINIEIISPVISPDGDGRDDVCLIRFHFDKPGYLINISLFDAAGRLVQHISRNVLAGILATIKWDGLDITGMPLFPGIYILRIETFHVQGERKLLKKPIVIARQ